MVVIGTPPDAFAAIRPAIRRERADRRPAGVPRAVHRRSSIATGQFRHGLDVVPRGHPGDGRAEVQVYAVPRRERRRAARPARHRHPRPAPGITQRIGRDVITSASTGGSRWRSTAGPRRRHRAHRRRGRPRAYRLLL